MKTIVGIQIDGTKIRAGAVGQDGGIIGPAISIPTRARNENAESICKRIASLVATVSTGDEAGIGIVCTGPVSHEQGMILDNSGLPTLNYFPICSFLEQMTSLPCCIDGDARAMITAEARFGAGKGFGRIMGFALGTELGSAFVQNGVIVEGATGCAGEIWASPYLNGIVKDFLSGTALSNNYRIRTGKFAEWRGLAELAINGDNEAIGLWDEFAEALAHAISWTVNVTDPDAVILCGSVVRSADLFIDKTDKMFRKNVCISSARHVKLLPGTLGNDCGVIGASIMAWNKLFN